MRPHSFKVGIPRGGGGGPTVANTLSKDRKIVVEIKKSRESKFCFKTAPPLKSYYFFKILYIPAIPSSTAVAIIPHSFSVGITRGGCWITPAKTGCGSRIYDTIIVIKVEQ
jgi:hypothetical protein